MMKGVISHNCHQGVHVVLQIKVTKAITGTIRSFRILTTETAWLIFITELLPIGETSKTDNELNQILCKITKIHGKS